MALSFIWLTIVSLGSRGPECPEFYNEVLIKWNGYCYSAHDEFLTFYEAEDVCAGIPGGNLLSDPNFLSEQPNILR